MHVCMCAPAVDEERQCIRLSQLLKWYRRDFGDGTEGGMLRAILPFLPQEQAGRLQAWLDRGDAVVVEYEPYDWTLNER